MKRCDLDSKDSPTKKSDFLSPFPWKQMSYFWSVRDLTSSWRHFEWATKVVSSHPIDKVTQVEAQSWLNTVIPWSDPCLLCCWAALSYLTANWHKKEARHLEESTLCQGWEGHCKQQFSVLWLHWGTRIAETFTAIPAEAHFSSLSLLSTDLNEVPFDRYWENKISRSASYSSDESEDPEDRHVRK